MYKFKFWRFFFDSFLILFTQERLKPKVVQVSEWFQYAVEGPKHVIGNSFIQWYLTPVPVKQLHTGSDVMDSHAVLIMDASAFPVESPAMTERSSVASLPKAAVDHLMDDDLVKSRCVIVEALGDGQRPCPSFSKKQSRDSGILPYPNLGHGKGALKHFLVEGHKTASDKFLSYLQGHDISLLNNTLGTFLIW